LLEVFYTNDLMSFSSSAASDWLHKFFRAFVGAFALSLLACAGGDQPPTVQRVNASVQTVTNPDRTLGTRFTAPPTNIGNGDGFAPQPFVNGDGHPAVMVVGHHSSGLEVGALDLATAERIVPISLGGDATSNGFGYVQDPSTKRFYIPTSNTSTNQLTISCLEGGFKPSLGETVSRCGTLEPVSGVLSRSGSELTADGLSFRNGRLYGAAGLADGRLQLICITVDGSPCAGFPLTLAADLLVGQANNVRFQALDDDRIAIGFNNNANALSAVCVDLSTTSSCGRVNAASNALTSQPLGLYSDTGSLRGFCAFSSASMTALACQTLDGNLVSGLNVTTPNQNSPQYGMAVRMPGSGKYMLTSLSGLYISCIDMAANGQSCGDTPRYSGTNANPYGSSFFKNQSTGDMCLLTYGDSKELGIFNVNVSSGALTEDLRCFATGGVAATWRISDPIPSVCPRVESAEWGDVTVNLGPLLLDGQPSPNTYGGDISIYDPNTSLLLSRRVFAQTNSVEILPLATLGIQLNRYRALEVQVRVLRANGYQLSAGYEMAASVRVDLACAR
jgi:hypothetical protein